MPVQVVNRERMDVGAAVMLPQVRVLRRQLGMGMLNLVGIVCGPEPCRQTKAE